MTEAAKHGLVWVIDNLDLITGIDEWGFLSRVPKGVYVEDSFIILSIILIVCTAHTIAQVHFRGSNTSVSLCGRIGRSQILHTL